MRGKGVQMDFITLDKTLDGIAGPIKFPEEYSKYSDFKRVYRTSEAAAAAEPNLR
jgi:hypothetical protein